MGLFDKTIAYENISEIRVEKSFVLIKTDNWFRKVSIGNLNTNYEAALDYLASRVETIGEIEFSGKEECIEHYFPGRGNQRES